MEWLWLILIGFFAGLLARAIKPGRDDMGIILTTVLGIAGALLAGFIGRALGWYEPDETAGFIGAVVGSLVVLLIVGLVRGKRHKAA